MGLRLACRSLRNASSIVSPACCIDTNNAHCDDRVESKFVLEGLVVEVYDLLEESTGERVGYDVERVESNS